MIIRPLLSKTAYFLLAMLITLPADEDDER